MLVLYFIEYDNNTDYGETYRMVSTTNTHTSICRYERYVASLVAVACGEGISREGG